MSGFVSRCPPVGTGAEDIHPKFHTKVELCLKGFTIWPVFNFVIAPINGLIYKNG